MPKARWLRVVSPPIEFQVKQTSDGWFEVVRNGKAVLVHMNCGRVAAARFQHKQVAQHFVQACQILEKRFQ